jgi:hypothetical protein
LKLLSDNPLIHSWLTQTGTQSRKKKNM